MAFLASGNFRAAVRVYRTHLGLTLLAILTLALGIGATSGIFGALDSLVLEGLPYKDAGRIAQIWNLDAARQNARVSISAKEFRELETDRSDFSELAIYQTSGSLMRTQGFVEAVGTVRASANLMQLLGVRPLYGRLFLPNEDTPGHDHVVILSNALWKKFYSEDPNAIGKPVDLNGEIFTIIGIMPANFYFPKRIFGLWTPLPIGHGDDENYDKMVIARLQPGIQLKDLTERLEVISKRIGSKGDRGQWYRLEALPLSGAVAENSQTVLFVLFGVATLLMLIACTVVSGLFLVIAIGRRREIGVRKALGATRLRIAWQFVLEGTLLAACGGIVGVGIASWVVRVIPAIAPPALLPVEGLKIERGVLLFALVVSLICGVVIGGISGVRSASAEISQLLKGAGPDFPANVKIARGFGGFGRVVIAEIAVAYLLLVGASLTLQSYAHLTNLKLGFDARNVFSIWVPLLAPTYESPEQRVRFGHEIIDEISALPGVTAASITGSTPPYGTSRTMDFSMVGRGLPTGSALEQARFQIVSPDYFKTMRIPLLRGNNFLQTDNTQTPAKIIVNQSMASTFWPGGNPIGSVLRLPGFGGTEAEIVGVVSDTRDVDVHVSPEPEMYLSFNQLPVRNFSVLVRTNRIDDISSAIRNGIVLAPTTQPLGVPESVSDMVDESSAKERFGSLLMVVFAGIAIILGLAGTYGIVWYSVRQREKEMGIRAALGASPTKLTWLIASGMLRLLFVALVLGIIGSIALTRTLSSILFGISPTDPATFSISAVVLGTAALAAAYIPARRAGRVDPMTVLRYE